MKESLSQLSSEQIKQAISECSQQLAINPETPQLHANLGDLYFQQKQWDKAIECYQKIVNLRPFSAEAHRSLASVYEKIGNQSKVTDHLFTLYKSDPDSFSVEQLYKLGQSLETQNKPGRAIICYREVISSSPDFFEAYQALGKMLAEQGKKEPTLEVYRLGVRNNPKDSQYYYALAQALAAQERWLWASKNYQKVVKLKPSPQAYYHWGMALSQLQEYEQALERFQQGQELKPSSQGYYYQGLILSKLEKYNLAQECWQKAIALSKDYPEPYYQLALLWQNQQQWRKAGLAYKKLLILDPKSEVALNGMGLVCYRLKRFKAAVACYTKAIKYSSEGSITEDEAFSGYQQILTDSDSATALSYYYLAKLYRSKSRFTEAVDIYQQSIELDPHFRDAYIALQYTPIAQEKLGDLIKFYRRIVKKHPDVTVAWGNLGDALTQKNLVPKAIECYRTASYQQAIQTYPNLAELDWKEKKEHGPDFIVAGASKSGTSSIYFYLSRHPQILLSHTKEIDFYWQNYKRGIDWYLAHFPTITDRNDFITGEATPNYLRFPKVAQRIKDTFPQTKIIILLRNPADRAISWHYHKLNTGLTNQSLGDAIEEEMARLATVSETEITRTGFYNPDNILSSLYIYKIKAWIELLGRDKFLILKSEDFYADPLTNMSQVFKFLDLPNCPLENYPKVNAGSYNQVDSQLRETLVDYFAPYNQQLEEYLDIKFDWE